MTEAQFQQQVTDYATCYTGGNGTITSMTLGSRREGWPDLYMTREARDAVAWEVKVGTHTTTGEQRGWLKALEVDRRRRCPVPS